METVMPPENEGQETEREDSGMSESPAKRIPRRIQVRQVTSYQASWTERGRGESGVFTLQLILDHGADEHILEVDEDDMDVLLKLLKRSEHTTYDLERGVLMFSNLDA
jgi:hypothetical protein